MTERLARKKPVVVNLGLFLERLPVWIMVLAAMVAVKAPKLAIVLLLGAYAWHVVGAGMVAVDGRICSRGAFRSTAADAFSA